MNNEVILLKCYKNSKLMWSVDVTEWTVAKFKYTTQFYYNLGLELEFTRTV